MRTKPTMYKRLLRSALAVSFVAALGFGVLGSDEISWGSGAAKAGGEISWSTEAGAGPGEISWSVEAASPAGEISWLSGTSVASDEISWVVAPTQPGA
ncbi:5'-nucleotidase [Streptomyces sp. NPDC059832]|uniref:5'-nucleotidase n=1 Tax=unclassified Streptomyces TaxID=2593676 RepID=UPI00365564D1